MSAYYNEHDPYAAQWLRNLIAKGLIPDGEVDTRSIVDVRPDDLVGYGQVHFFAGIGGWAYAARLAGWPDDRPLWTGSCPCQPFSAAGKQKGIEDERHLWPVFFNLIAACQPPVVMGEQVAAAVGKHWLDGVQSDLEGIGYAVGAAVVPACAVDAPHRRDRLWFVADADSVRGQVNSNTGRCEDGSRARSLSGFVGACDGYVADAGRGRRGEPCQGQDQFARRAQAVGTGHGDVADAHGARSASWIPAPHGRREGNAEVAHDGSNRRAGPWGECDWIKGADGKARRVKSGLPLLAHGVPARVGRLRAYGNAIVPQVAAEVISAFMEAQPC